MGPSGPAAVELDPIEGGGRRYDETHAFTRENTNVYSVEKLRLYFDREREILVKK